jgi:Zn-dependent metalloprotease
MPVAAPPAGLSRRPVAPRGPLACIVPPDLLLQLAHEHAGTREAVLKTLSYDMSFRSLRAQAALRPQAQPPGERVFRASPAGQPQRTIYDQRGSTDMVLGHKMRGEGDPAGSDPAVNEAYDGFGATYRFWWEVFGRDSIDGRGEPLNGLVHFGQKYDNAFWDGEGHMVFGDGDGELFTRFTKSVDVIGHELAHGVTQTEANLIYNGQSGALNESLSDVFGVLVSQYAQQQSADKADWLIGADIVGAELAPALRSLKAPGTANKHDTQPADMDHYVHTGSDNGGVHTNSGIPNHAFYVIASTLGGYAWERAGRIWYSALRDPKVRPSTGFRGFARATLRQAQGLYGHDSTEAQAVSAGWDAVKVDL